MKSFDAVIIGAGAVGNAIARELSKYEMSVCVIEKEADTAFGISGRNSGVLHSGFNNKPGTLMAELCVQGSRGFAGEAAGLGIKLDRTGKLVTALYDEDVQALYLLKEQGEANHVDGLEIISSAEIRKINENISGVAALLSNATGIFDPFLYTIALAEEAILNGAEYRFFNEVTGIAPCRPSTGAPMATDGRRYQITCVHRRSQCEERIEADWVINSTGLHSDHVCKMLGIKDFIIHPCRGEYHILDKKIGSKLRIPVYPVPNEKSGGLGVHLTPTVHGNLMIGPSAEYVSMREDFSTTESIMNDLFAQGSELFPGIEKSGIIRSFAGIRPKLAAESEGGYHDFIIRESERNKGFVILAGIESPGLTASIPVAKKVAEIIFCRNQAKHKKLFRRRIDAIQTEQDYGPSGSQRLVCLCESKSEIEILKAYDQIAMIGAIPTMKGIKNRTGAGMGNCQGSFCTVNIIDLLERKRGVDPLGFFLDGPGSNLFAGRTR